MGSPRFQWAKARSEIALVLGGEMAVSAEMGAATGLAGAWLATDGVGAALAGIDAVST